MEERAKNFFAAAFFAVVLLGSVIYVEAAPTAPSTLNAGESSTRTVSGTKTVTAVAGNITQLTINGTTQTSAWQGYYGNVSGRITLDDGNDNTFYDWELTVMKGEVYAARAEVTWTSISCLNYTADGDVEVNLTGEESALGMRSSDADGVDETFASYNHPLFYVGQTTFAANSCPSTNLYKNGEQSADSFYEVLLQDDSSVVYTSILEDQSTGFDGNPWDFQLLVGEDGHGNGDSTLYYFYMELG